jgi:hypothetical protein
VATAYEAIVRVRTRDVSREREEGVLRLLRQGLPAEAMLETRRDPDDRLHLMIQLALDGADASDVQLRAHDLAAAALQHAGLAEEGFALDDISVRSSS